MDWKRLKVSDDSIAIEYMYPEDVLYMVNHFKRHSDVMYRPYDFDEMDFNQCRNWLRRKNGLRNAYFKIALKSGEIIGYLGIKNIGIFRKTSTLGFVIDPNYAGKGYGKRALRLFLKEYFDNYKMKLMTLEVVSFNEAAQKLYESMGFKEDYRYMDYHDDDILKPEDIDMTKYSGVFNYRGRISTYIYHMKLKSSDFIRTAGES